MAGLSRSKILVTGATGFIGSHLVEKLSTLGYDVLATDIQVNPRSYFIVNKIHRNIPFSFLDVRDRKAVLESLSEFKPDYIIHLAAQTLVTVAFENPYETLETNILGTINILESSRNNENIKGIIVASSDKAYGKTLKTYKESAPLKGDHPYDVSKSCTDLICQTYFKTYNSPVVVSRFGNVYGEGDFNLDRIVPGICESVIRNKTLNIRSNGKYVRDYLYVNDVVNGYLSLLQNITKIKGEAFNFSSTDKLSVIQLIRLAERAYGKEIPFRILNNAKNEIPYQHLDDSKIRKLGWKNESNFRNVFNQILDWYVKVL